MKLSLISILLLASCSETIQQSTSGTLTPLTSTSVPGGGSIAAGLDPTLVSTPNRQINFPGCFKDIANADKDGDGILKKNEYLGFIQDYAQLRKCIQNPILTLQQRSAFNSLSCLCSALQGAAADCCLGEKAQIWTTGALNPQRTQSQLAYLTSVCRITDATLGPNECPPEIIDRSTPPPAIINPASPFAPVAASSSSKRPDWWIWLLVALAALLLLCCCCCFAFKKRKAKEIEEEEEVVIPGDPKPPDATEEQFPQDGATARNIAVDDDTPVIPVVIPPPVVPSPDEEEEDEEEARKRRGGGLMAEDPDPTPYPKYGAPRYPPPEPTPGFIALRPISKETEEPDEWDQPGREINHPRIKTEDEGQVFDPYIPDGGVYFPEREGRDPVDWRNKWERQEPEEPDEYDGRKHRIQAGLGEGEVFNRLNDDEGPEAASTGNVDMFDWVMETALGALVDAEEGKS